ncbi:MAG: phenazine biosynthesis protein PhzE [Alphaproteobacteria bacterium]|nr:phenazine biosynthesis protein PhzE [Alphaproteobacteria bacterium]
MPPTPPASPATRAAPESIDTSQPYCLIHQHGKTRCYSGSIQQHFLLAELPIATADYPVISMVPYAQMRERGFELHDGGEPIISLQAEKVVDIALDKLLGDGEQAPKIVEGPQYDLSDQDFEQAVAQVIAREICQGEGSNFLLSRKGRLRIDPFNPAIAHQIFARLASNEFGAYMSFCFFDGQRYFIGSSPERHISIHQGLVQMNPICGTLPKATLNSRQDLIDFLSDTKEINELFQVVDETLKMMSAICVAGGEIQGPFLREMSAVVHTEYVLAGQTTMNPVDAFRASMFAPTMVGSPLQNAARIIKKYERESRRYYSSAIVVRSLDELGQPSLDSAITIRTMEVGLDGQAIIQSGASIVRDSQPAKERLEVVAKGQGLLRAITTANHSPLQPVLARFMDDQVAQVLAARNRLLSRFWFEKQISHTPGSIAPFCQASVLIIDNEDQFTQMLKHMLDRLGMQSRLIGWASLPDDPWPMMAGFDLVLVGPGPGDPNDQQDPKMRRVHAVVDQLLTHQATFIAICLGHQILSLRLGMRVAPVDPPRQGVQKIVDLFGQQQPIGFYNTFFARPPTNPITGVDIAVEPEGLVSALRSQKFYSFQGHIESVLTTNGIDILKSALQWLLPERILS